jgi:hypothetical protein
MARTMIDDVTERLKAHAEGTENADNPKNLADHVWLLKHQRAASDLDRDEIWAALLVDFELLNALLNECSDFHLGRSLAYAINGISNICLDVVASQYGDELARQMLELAWRIGTAWDAILAGDIERIGEHVELEKSARGI